MKSINDILTQVKQALVICLFVLACACQATTFDTGPLYRGGGVAGDPFLLYKAEDLLHVGKPGPAGSEYADFTLSAHYEQVIDINLAGKTWVPIGARVPVEIPFEGVYDGNNKKIKNLTINAPSDEYIGLFGFIDFGGIVRNIVLENAIITGDANVAGVVGMIRSGTVENCYLTAGTVITSRSDVGGVVGQNIGTVRNCYVAGRVICTIEHGGGVVGDNDGTVQNCYATGSVTGSTSGQFIGGVVGRQHSNITRNCVALNSTVTGSTDVGRVAGGISGGSMSNNYARNDMSVSFSVIPSHTAKDGETINSGDYLDAGWWTNSSNWTVIWDIGIWNISNGRLPVLW